MKGIIEIIFKQLPVSEEMSMKEIDKQLKTILYHIEKLKPEIEKYLSNHSMETKKKILDLMTTLCKANKKLSKRKINPALTKLLTATDALAEIVGKKRITRQEAVKQFWKYVKKHNLQDPKDKRVIKSDEPLKKVFGDKEQVTMFEATTLISKNLK